MYIYLFVCIFISISVNIVKIIKSCLQILEVKYSKQNTISAGKPLTL